MSHQRSKGANFETEDNLRQPKDEDRAHTTQQDLGEAEANVSDSVPSTSSGEAPNQNLEDSEKKDHAHTTQQDLGEAEANISDSVPSTSSGEAPNQNLEDLLKKLEYAMEKELWPSFREFWDDYWNIVLQHILQCSMTRNFKEVYAALFNIRRKIMTDEFETFKKKLNTQPANEEEGDRNGNTHMGMERNEADDNDSMTSRSSSEAPNQGSEDTRKKDTKGTGKFTHKYKKCWHDYWNMILEQIRNGVTLSATPDELYERHFQSISPEPRKYDYKDLAKTISLRSWRLLNPTQREHQGEEVIICRFQLPIRYDFYIIEQQNDAGASAEDILLKRLRMLKEEVNYDIIWDLELVCSWSSRKRCIKLAKDIKEVHKKIVKIIIRTKSEPKTPTSSLPDLEVQHLDIDWEELYEYLTEEGKAYAGKDVPPEQICEVLNRSVEHRRVLPLQMWYVFNEQLRTGIVTNIACIVCCVTFRSAAPYCIFQANEVRDLHAEAATFMRLEAMQAEANKREDSISHIRIYTTYSPCVDCISRYSKFLERMATMARMARMPELELHVIVSSVYLSDNYRIRSALYRFWRKWQNTGKVKLEAFAEQHWAALREHLSEEGTKYLEDKAKRFQSSHTHYHAWM